MIPNRGGSCSPSKTASGGSPKGRLMSPARFGELATADRPPEGRWLPYPHLMLLNEIAMEVSAGTNTRQLTSTPPQVGKSMFMSMIAPVWILGCHPNRRHILGSYNASYASDLGHAAREFMREFGPGYFGLDVDPQRDARDFWGLVDIRTNRPTLGSFKTFGMDAGFTGNPCEHMWIDDPFKGWEDSSSQTHRDKVWKVFTSCIQSRLRSTGTLCITYTPWNEDDLGGRLLGIRMPGLRYTRIPALAEEPLPPEVRARRKGYASFVGAPDPMGRPPGRAICPAMYTEAHYAGVKALDPDVFDALYQCNPHPAEGRMFKRIWFKDRITRDAPACDSYVRYWDKAASKGKGNHTCGALLGVNGTSVWVVDIARDRLEPAERDAWIRRVAEADRLAYGHVATWGEHAGNDAKESAANFVKNLAGFFASTEGTGNKDKGTRAYPFASYCGAGNVFLREGPWNDAFVDELCDFDPNAASGRDDQVDAASGAFGKLTFGEGDRCAAGSWSPDEEEVRAA